MLPFRIFTIALLLWSLNPLQLQAAAVNVRIVGPSTSFSAHDISAIAAELNNMLAATSGYSGSSAAATVLSSRSLTEAYYHPSYRDATRAAVTDDYDYLVILPETQFLHSYPEMTFDGVLQMSRKALDVGTTPLMLMPGTGTTAYVSTLGTHTYRIANGCGIHAIPGGYAAQSANLLGPSTANNKLRQAYLLAATVFTRITGLNAASDTSYSPSISNFASLAGTAVTTTNTHNTTTHYTTSRENSGLVRYRNITPPNNTLKYAYTGTSTERGINSALTPIIAASGFTAGPYYPSSTIGWTQTTLDTVTPTFNANPNQYLFAYGRTGLISLQGQVLINTNQANLLPFDFDRHYDGIGSGTASINNMLDDIYNRSEDQRWECINYGWLAIPVHLGAARLNDIDPTVIFSSDGTHVTAPLYSMIASMMVTSSIGREPTPTAAILADSQQLNGFNVGKQTIRQLAFLAETEAHVPDTALSIVTLNSLEAVKGLAFDQTFTATNGTPPYTWSEESTAGLPAGLTLSADGRLSGIVTADPGVWQLVLKVKDSTGAIRKAPQTLTVTLIATGANAFLSNLAPSIGTLEPAFSSEVLSYTSSVHPSVSSMTVTPTAVEPSATITVNGSPVASGNPSAAINLNVGSNVITTEVVSQDLSTTKTYVLTVTRPTPSSNADLANLASNNAALSPSFAGNALNYTASVPFGTDSLTLTPTAAETYAIITVNGSPVSSGTPSGAISLNVGNNVITTQVTSSDLSITKTYTLTVMRAASVSRWWDGGSADIATPGDGISQGGASGVWDTTTQNWDQGSGQAHVAWNNVNGDIAIFGGTAGTVTTQDVRVGGLTFTSAYTLNGGTITFASAGTISNSAAVTINSTLTGSGPITKSGAGTLSLGNTTNTYTGGTIINAGNIDTIRSNSFGAGKITIAGTSTLSTGHSVYPVLANELEINTGATVTFSLATQFYTMTIDGVLSGNGTVQVTGSNAGATFRNAANTFTGTLIGSGNGITLNSLPDSTNPIQLNNGTFTLGTGSASPLLFNNRRIQLAGTTNGGRINNNNATTGNTITIHADLLVTGVGNKTFTLGGSNSGNNAFNGAIANATGSVISLSKADAGIWILSGNNTYTGNTSISGTGTLIFRNASDSLPDGTRLVGGSGNNNTSNIRLLDDDAGPIPLGNTIAMGAPGSSGTGQLNVFVGNNSTANGGSSSSGTTTGSTMVMGALDFRSSLEGGNSDSRMAQVFNVSGANGYNLQVSNVILQARGTASAGAIPLTPTSASLIITGTVQQNNGRTATDNVALQTLSLAGSSSSNQISGNILDAADFTDSSNANALALNVTKSGTSIWTLTGTNTYSGATTISSGTLQLGDGTSGKDGTIGNSSGITNNATLVFNRFGNLASHVAISGTGAVIKTGPGSQTLSGNNSYTGTTTVTAGSWFINGNQTSATGNVSVSADATLGGTGIIGGSTTIAPDGQLEFNLGTSAASHDKLELAAGKSLTFSGASMLTITYGGGASPGTYTLVSAPGGITGPVPTTLILPENWAATVSISGDNKDLLLNVTSTGVIADPYAAWALGGVAFDADTNGDGVKNGLAWLLGAADPLENALNKLPVASLNSDKLRLTFRCLKSTKRGGVLIKVQSSSDLGTSDPWASYEAAVPETNSTVNGVVFTISADAAPDFINVTADIPAAGTKLFGRLQALKP